MRKKKISEEIKFEKSEADKRTDSNDFVDKLSENCKGLSYISETDAEFTIFNGEKTETLTKEIFSAQIKSSPNVAVEEQNFKEFFLRLTTIKDWFGGIEKQNAKRFAELEDLFESNLKELKIFRVGKIKIDIYIVGIDAENNLIGLKTYAVET